MTGSKVGWDFWEFLPPKADGNGIQPNEKWLAESTSILRSQIDKEIIPTLSLLKTALKSILSRELSFSCNTRELKRSYAIPTSKRRKNYAETMSER